jgi:hypothetical protein
VQVNVDSFDTEEPDGALATTEHGVRLLDVGDCGLIDPNLRKVHVGRGPYLARLVRNPEAPGC